MSTKPNPAETGIKTVYHRRNEPPKITRALNANRAVATAVAHMQINQYGSHLCEVYDSETGELHAIIKRSVNGRLTIDFQRDPRAYETRYAVSFILGH